MQMWSLLVALLVSAVLVSAATQHNVKFVPAVDATHYGLVQVNHTSFRVETWASLEAKNLTGDVVASAYFNASLHQIGWDYLAINATKVLHEGMMEGWNHYHAGYLEGYLTCSRVLHMHAMAILRLKSRRTTDRRRFQKGSFPTTVMDWVQQQVNFTTASVNANRQKDPKDRDPFWVAVGEVFRQLQGSVDGCNAKLGWDLLDFEILYLLNLDAELGTIDKAVRWHKSQESFTLDDYLAPSAWLHHTTQRRSHSDWSGMHCSALIKVLRGDLFASQATWSPYVIMFRVMKRYTIRSWLERNASTEPTTVQFSSYPGFVSSADDWYQTYPHQMVVQETTNGFYNQSLLAFVKPKSVAEFVRVVVANHHTTKGGEQWSQWFARHNSGTYNNQYMVVDFKKFTGSSAPDVGPLIRSGLLWIVEQIPGRVEAADKTDVLSSQGYWPSYNIPYFPSIYNQSGFAEKEARDGTFFSYEKYSRAEIFRRNHTDVIDLATMKLIMRYNDFKVDPLSLIRNCSNCPAGVCSPQTSAMNAIASRGDLNPTEGCYGLAAGYLGHQSFGAIDAKIGSWSHRNDMTMHGISGPTNVQQPTYKSSMPLLPEVWDFPWVTFESPPQQ